MSWLLPLLGVILLLWGVYLAAPGVVYRLAMAVERALARLRHRHVTVGEHRLVYLDGGRGEPVVLLHGFGADRYHWPRFARHLTRDHRVVAPDLPGFGESSRLEDQRYDLDAQLGRLLGFLDALGLARVHLVGNSMGGHLAAAFLRRYPARVRTLALLDAGGVEPRGETPFVAALREGHNLLLTDSPQDFRRLTALMFVRAPFLPGRVLDYLGARAAARRDWNEHLFSQYFDDFDELERGPLPPRVPTLILWGREDRVLPVENARVLQERFPHAAVHLLDATGHLPMLERPGRVAALYRDFLHRARADGGAAPADRATATDPAQVPSSSSR